MWSDYLFGVAVAIAVCLFAVGIVYVGICAYVFCLRASHFYKMGVDPKRALSLRERTFQDILKDGQDQDAIDNPQWL
tara:strand:- start:2292 stop:2522 length:231 start_codon:yes stop_codon:yes gene_type:complete